MSSYYAIYYYIIRKVAIIKHFMIVKDNELEMSYTVLKFVYVVPLSLSYVYFYLPDDFSKVIMVIYELVLINLYWDGFQDLEFHWDCVVEVDGFEHKTPPKR